MSKEVDFIENLFSYLCFKQGLAAEFEKGCPVSSNEETEFTEDIGKAVLLLSYTYRPLFRKKIQKVFPVISHCIKHLDGYIVSFCCRPYDDRIYFVELLTTFAFVSELGIMFFNASNYDNFSFCPQILIEVLEEHLCTEFCAKGGYLKLKSDSYSFARMYEKLEPVIRVENPQRKIVPLYEAFVSLLPERSRTRKVEVDASSRTAFTETEILEHTSNALLDGNELGECFSSKSREVSGNLESVDVLVNDIIVEICSQMDKTSIRGGLRNIEHIKSEAKDLADKVLKSNIAEDNIEKLGTEMLSEAKGIDVSQYSSSIIYFGNIIKEHHSKVEKMKFHATDSHRENLSKSILKNGNLDIMITGVKSPKD